MNQEAFKQLIDQYITGNLPNERRAEFASLLEQPEYRSLLEAELEHSFMEDLYEGVEPAQRKESINKLILEKIAGQATPTVTVHRVHLLQRTWARLAIAAILIIVTGAFFFKWSQSEPRQQVATNDPKSATDIVPGHHGAILTLADGTRIVLDSAQRGTLAQQGGSALVLDQHRLTYQPNQVSEVSGTYNELIVPRGRQFQLVLPDGTKVWLNAASSIRYPTAFTGKERLVEITGEAYFEVAHLAAKPFIVKKGATETKVLGTHFNINAYDDESTQNITLLQGSVQVKNGNKAIIIQPGQQAQVGEGIRIASQVDLEEVVAWKDGKFRFGETADIQSIMRQVANWYDVDVVYKGKVDKHIGGTISRNVNLSLLLKMLETTGAVDFKVAGKTVTVISK